MLNAGNIIMNKSTRASDLTEFTILVFKTEKIINRRRTSNISCFWHSSLFRLYLFCFVFPNSKMREEREKQKKKTEHQSRSLQSPL